MHHNNKLQMLAIENNKSISDEAFARVVSGCVSLNSLRGKIHGPWVSLLFIVRGCKRLGDLTINAISQHVRMIEGKIYHSCGQITDGLCSA